jgi:hypothetical protein
MIVSLRSIVLANPATTCSNAVAPCARPPRRHVPGRKAPIKSALTQMSVACGPTMAETGTPSDGNAAAMIARPGRLLRRVFSSGCASHCRRRGRRTRAIRRDRRVDLDLHLRGIQSRAYAHPARHTCRDRFTRILRRGWTSHPGRTGGRLHRALRSPHRSIRVPVAVSPPGSATPATATILNGAVSLTAPRRSRCGRSFSRRWRREVRPSQR